MKKVVLDGEVLDESEAVISVFDRGFLYGDSVFETVRTYGGDPYALDEHLERLERSAERVAIRVPVSRATLAEEVRCGIAAADNEESYVRIMVTRGSGPLGLDPSLGTDGRRVILVTPLSVPPPEVYEDGVRVVTWRGQRATDVAGVQGAKVANYLVAVLATAEARKADAYEALILDGEGFVLEGATCNVFFVRDGVIATPPEEGGILPGITRARVLAVAREKGYAVSLETARLDELSKSDEIFITSSIREIVPVVQVDDHPIGSGKPGPVTRDLIEGFRSSVPGGGLRR